MVYRTASQIDFSPSDLPALPKPGRVLLTTPDFFEVKYVINPHMAGNIDEINPPEAKKQWLRLREAYETLGFQPLIVKGVEGLPDMVFCANQTLPYYSPENGERGVVLSRMYADERKEEVSHYAQFFRQHGFEVIDFPSQTQTNFEGMGDAIWHPGRYLLWGGYGFRTDSAAYDYLSEALDVRILALQLDDPDFYHLDTCFSALDEETVLIYPGAFQPEGLELIKHLFQHVVEAPENEARTLFACNAHCPDGKHVLIQSGCEETNLRLKEAGFTPLALETGEFLKAGGSVFCMKQMLW